MSGIKVEQYLNPQDDLWGFVEKVVKAEGFFLYDLAKPRAGLLRVFIERSEVPGNDMLGDGSDTDTGNSDGTKSERSTNLGVSADDCITVCRRLMDAFAVDGQELGIGSEPDLEVSSPGLDRGMRLESHFAAEVGSNVKVWLDGKAITGILEDFKEKVLFFRELEASNVTEIPFVEVRKAQKVF